MKILSLLPCALYALRTPFIGLTRGTNYEATHYVIIYILMLLTVFQVQIQACSSAPLSHASLHFVHPLGR